LVEIMEDKLASKQDLLELERRIDAKFSRIDLSFAQLKSDMTIRMGTMMAASIAILTALHKLV
jgi:hypothetical protein